MRMHIALAVMITLLLLHASSVSVSAEIYYATPSLSTTRPREDAPCFTLSQYATKLENYFTSSNTTFILLPGIHHLKATLQFVNIEHLTIQATRKVSVECSKLGRFVFKSIHHAYIGDIEFFSCYSYMIVLVNHFHLQDCEFDGSMGMSHNYGVLNVSDSSITVEKCTFANNVAYLGRSSVMYNQNSTVAIRDCTFTNNTSNEVGGVMENLNSNVTIFNSVYVNNKAKFGGAVYFQYTNVTIHNSTFIDNRATQGGAMQLAYGIATIIDSTFSNNTGTYGGVALHIRSSVFIVNCRFTNNVARLGGTMYQSMNASVAVLDSIFGYNKAMLGGVLFDEQNGNVTIHNSLFSYNTASKEGGVMEIYYGNLLVLNSGFFNNTVGIDGGVMAHTNTKVTVYNCTFANNTARDHGGVMTQQHSIVAIYNSRFINNSADGFAGVMTNLISHVIIKNSTFSHNAAIRYSGVMDFVSSNVTIHDSTFTDNKVEENAAVMQNWKSRAEIHNSSFTNNQAAKNGGVIYNDFTDFKSYGNLIISKNKANWSILWAFQGSIRLTGNITISDNNGALFILSSDLRFSGLTSIMHNSQATSSQKGGVLISFQSLVVFLGETTIVDNRAENASGGAISLIESKLYTFGNTTLSNNKAMNGGGIYAYQSELNLEGGNIIRQNTAQRRGGGIHAVGSTVKVLSAHLIDNSAYEGGGISLELNSKIYIVPKFSNDIIINRSPDLATYLSVKHYTIGNSTAFSNNTAAYGGAVFVSDDSNSGICESGYEKSGRDCECFLQVLLDHTPDDIKVDFTNNLAEERGDTIYGGLLDRCLLNDLSPELEFVSTTSESYITRLFTIEERDIKSVISSKPVRVCFCQNNHPNCSYHPPTLYVWKGETFKVSLVAVDQVNNTISNTSIHSSPSPQAGLGEGQSIQTTDDGCTELEYAVTSPHDTEYIALYAEGPCKDSGISANSFKVEFKPCPIGFIDAESKCACDRKLLQNGYVKNCSIDTESVLKNSNGWLSYANTSHGADYLAYSYCPFDYCHPSIKLIWINLNIPNGADSQCAFNRSGQLCGSCKYGYSVVLGSSRCMPCSNNWLAILISFATAGLVLVVFVHILKITVLDGTINALIFYANTVFSSRTVFMPFHSPNLWSVFIAWLNLDLGFETCFYDGMDGYVKTWLQLAFPAYIILFVVIVIITSEYSGKLTRFISHRRNPITTLATLVLLSYTKILRTVIDALVFATLKYPDGSFETVWLIDANVRYFEWKHILLIAVAVSILMVGLVFTSLLLFWQCLQKCPNKKYLKLFTYSKLYSFMDVYLAPYNMNHRYYFGTLLIARVILYIVSALTSHLGPSYILLSTTCVMTCLLVLELYANIFKHWPHRLLETLFLINLTFFAAGTNYNALTNVEGAQVTLAIISITIVFGTFLGILLYHVYYALLPQKFLSKLKHIFRRKQDSQPQPQLPSIQADDSIAPTYTEVDACPPIEDTDSHITIETETLTVNTGEGFCSSQDSNSHKHVSCASTSPQPSDAEKGTYAKEPKLRQNELNIELQSFDDNKMVLALSGETKESHDSASDDRAPLLI